MYTTPSPFGDELALEVGSGCVHYLDFHKGWSMMILWLCAVTPVLIAVATPIIIGIRKAQFGGYTTGGEASRDWPMGQSPILPKSRK